MSTISDTVLIFHDKILEESKHCRIRLLVLTITTEIKLTELSNYKLNLVAFISQKVINLEVHLIQAIRVGKNFGD